MENCTEFPQKTKKTTIWSNNFTSGYLFEESENIIWNDRYAYVCCCCLVTKSCLTPCNPMDCSLSGSFVHGIFPGKNTGESCHFLLQGSSWPRDPTHISFIADRFFTPEPPRMPSSCTRGPLKSCQNWKTEQWPQDWKRSVFIPIPKKGNAKIVQTTTQLHSSHTLAK